jgi:hypothetical protein
MQGELMLEKDLAELSVAALLERLNSLEPLPDAGDRDAEDAGEDDAEQDDAEDEESEKDDERMIDGLISDEDGVADEDDVDGLYT